MPWQGSANGTSCSPSRRCSPASPWRGRPAGALQPRVPASPAHRPRAGRRRVRRPLRRATGRLGAREVPDAVPLPLRLAPGWDGVRTPGRINTLTSLGLACSRPPAYLLRRSLGRRTPGAVAATRLAPAAVAGLLLARSWLEGLGPMPLARVPAAPKRCDGPPPRSCTCRSTSTSAPGTATGRSGTSRPSRTARAPSNRLEQLRRRVESFPDGARCRRSARRGPNRRPPSRPRPRHTLGERRRPPDGGPSP